ncbi:F-box only protein 42-like, partial [Mercenaria mercenaria]|uniref:F-box only protein 42-like n=1 Tax=Mercenaria mercenaria TaxID=6596 RepID=UPI00234ED01E
VVLRKLHQTYLQSVFTSKIEWSCIQPEAGSHITERYSHSCCYYDKSLYVFGGCTATNTTLNDLWRFDLATREWIRPLAMGTYPYPKACASLVVYKDNLVLFGGWSHPTPFPLHQAARFFSELHIYKPSTNRWSHVTTLSHQSPQPIAGHSASIIGDYMVIFGGSQIPGIRTNEVWLFDFNEQAWRMPRIGYRRPAPRYGQTQVTIDDSHILIVGGCGGGTPNQVYNDCWLLTVGEDEWTWDLIVVENPQWAAPQLWCNSACKVSDMIVTLSKAAKPLPRTVPVSPRAYKPRGKIWVPPREDEIEQPTNPANQSQAPGSPDTLPTNQSEQTSDSGNVSDQSEASDMSPDSANSQSDSSEPEVGTSNPRPGLPSVRPNAMKNRQKQLEALLKYEKRFRHTDMVGPSDAEEEPPRLSQNLHNIRQQKSPTVTNLASLMTLHVLDISRVLECKVVSWQKLNFENMTGAPTGTIFYSLVEGQNEILMFGGIEKDIHALQRGQGIQSHTVNNALYIISPIQHPL